MTPTTHTTTSPLTSLRTLTPRRVLTFTEALRIAELQARRLADLIDDPTGIHEHHIAGLPRITIHRQQLPVSGMSHWNGHQWVITINSTDPLVRQRFTLLHEFKHIIDHGAVSQLYTGGRTKTPQEQAETAADYFAGCALVGRRELKSAWGNRIQHVEDLAAHFGVSIPAIRVRLAQTGLDIVADRLPTPRCARPVTTPRDQTQRFHTVQTRHYRRSYA